MNLLTRFIIHAAGCKHVLAGGMMHGDGLSVSAVAEEIAQEIDAARSCATSAIPSLNC